MNFTSCRRYVYLWSSRIGYSLSPSPDVICNFISLDDVSCAEAVDPECKDCLTKSDFVVQVMQSSTNNNIEATNKNDLPAANDVPKFDWPEHHLSQRSEVTRTPWFKTVRQWLRKASSFQLPALNSPSEEVQVNPKPYFFRASSVSERNKWIHHINVAVVNFQNEKRRKLHEQGNFLLRNQAWMRDIYTSIIFRMATAFCVGVNFLAMVSVLCSLPGVASPLFSFPVAEHRAIKLMSKGWCDSSSSVS